MYSMSNGSYRQLKTYFFLGMLSKLYNQTSFDRMSEEISFFWYVDSLSKLFLENRLD